MSNSKLVNYTQLSPNCNKPRNHKIDTTFKNNLENYATNFGLECEFRPNGVTKDTVWSGATSFSSNIPNSYYEFQPSDPDDIAICCRELSFMSAETSYYGYLYLTKQPSFTNTTQPYTFETEYGKFTFVGADYLPLRYTQYPSTAKFGTTYNW